MSKFLSKKDISPEEFSKMSPEEQKEAAGGKTLKEFWDRNKWAKERWSIAMTKSWEIFKSKEAAAA